MPFRRARSPSSITAMVPFKKSRFAFRGPRARRTAPKGRAPSILSRLLRLSSPHYISRSLFTDWPSISTIATVQKLTGLIIGGSTPVQANRTGDTIFLQDMRLQGTLAIGDATNAFRIMIYLVDSDYAGDANWSLDTAVDTRFSNDKLHKIYYDKIHVLDGDRPLISLDIRIRFSNLKIKYQANSTLADNEEFSGLRVLMVSDSGAAVHPGFTQGNLTMWYKNQPF